MQKGFVIWLTGLSGSGKTTLGDRIEGELKRRGYLAERLDGDLIRKYLWKDLGFTKEDRDEHIRRVGFLSALLSRNGVGVIASFISPYRAQREGVRKEVQNFIEVFCSCPLEVCKQRDKKGLYKKAERGEIPNFTGVSDPYEFPENSNIELHTDTASIEENTQKILDYLKGHGYIQ